MTELQQGIYHLLITKVVQEQIKKQGLQDQVVAKRCSKEELIELLSQQVGIALKSFLLQEFEKQEGSSSDESEESVIEKILSECLEGDGLAKCLGGIKPITVGENLLREVKPAAIFAETQRPFSDVNEVALITPNELSLGSQLLAELKSCDRADWIVSFIKHSAIKHFYEELKTFCSKPNSDGSPRLRIATTTYMGISDYRALELLLSLPNTEIRVAYEHDERHHAKAYLFYRKTGFSTAYVGSANLSTSAMNRGLEWTVKFPEMTMPEMWNRTCAAFNSNWMDGERFKLLTKDDLGVLAAALKEARQKIGAASNELSYFSLTPHHYQTVALDALARERANDDNRHLLVAATGTGKTMIAAFDYKRLCEKKKSLPPMLFIAHRKDILEQAIKTYRAVLRDSNFGEVLSGMPIQTGQHLFSTVASWTNHVRDKFAKNHFKAIIVDECHHAMARTYDEMLSYYKDVIDDGQIDLLGLTATPDREDGKDIREFFNGKITHELSLKDAINNNFLVPFDYFALSDTSDFSSVRWGSQSADADVQGVVEANEERAQLVYNAVLEYVNSPLDMRAIGFCAGIKHAELMSRIFNEKGIPSRVLTGASKQEEREEVRKCLTTFDADKRINVIFVADLFNEGVDIPEVDTLLMLRPTDSATIFTQQLGRGLRKADKKENVLVIDFVAKQNDRFNGALKFNVLTLQKTSVAGIREQIEHDMPFLPQGCSITLTQVAKDAILDNLKRYIARLRGQKLVSAVQSHIRSEGKALSVYELMKLFGVNTPHVFYENGILPHVLADETLSGHERDRKDAEKTGRFLLSLAENDNPRFLSQWADMLKMPNFYPSQDENERVARFNLITAFDMTKVRLANTDEYWKKLITNPDLKADVEELIQWRNSSNLPHLPKQYDDFPLRLHCRYSRTQICAAMGGDGYVPQQGLLRGKGPLKKYTAFFVTRNKEYGGFSVNTSYKDFAITEKTFQWESQYTTRANSEECKDYISGARIPLLFLQEEKKTAEDVARGFIFLGKLKYISHEKECPVRFKWQLETPMPSDVFEWAKV